MYVANGSNVEGTMGEQTISSSATSLDLLASNFSREGYGFAGWNTKKDGTGTSYGPQEDITFTAGQYSTTGLTLYAKWIASAGNIQTWTGCSSLATGAVTALKDQCDNNVYAVAKLADGNCRMIENLRLDNTATITSVNTDNPASGFISLSPSSDDWCEENTEVCINQNKLNTNNTNLDGTNASNTPLVNGPGQYNGSNATGGPKGSGGNNYSGVLSQAVVVCSASTDRVLPTIVATRGICTSIQRTSFLAILTSMSSTA